MRRLLVPLLVALVVAPVAASAQAPEQLPTVELPPELDRVLRDYEREWQARSAEGLGALFAEDGFVLRPGRPPARGREAIIASYRGAGGPLALRAFGYEVADSIGYMVGGFARAPGDPDMGKWVLLLRKGADGRWLITGDIDNGN